MDLCETFPEGDGRAFVQKKEQWKHLSPKGSPDKAFAVHVCPLPSQGNGRGCITFYLKTQKAVIDGGGGDAVQAGVLASLISDWTRSAA